MKLSILFLILILQSVVQGLNSREIIETEHQKFVQFSSGLKKIIHQIIESAKSYLEKWWKETENLVQNEIILIEKAITNGKDMFNHYLEYVKAEFKELEEEAKPCFENSWIKINSISLDTKSAVEKCGKEGREKFMEIQDDIKEYRRHNQEAVEGVQGYIIECSNQLNFIERIKCVIGVAHNITNTVGAIRDNTEKSIKTVSERIQNVKLESSVCLEKESKNAVEMVQEVLEETRQCIESITTSPSEETTSKVFDEEPEIEMMTF